MRWTSGWGEAAALVAAVVCWVAAAGGAHAGLAPLVLPAVICTVAELVGLTPGADGHGGDEPNCPLERLARALIDVSSEAAFMIDDDRTVRALNRAAARLLDAEMQTVVGTDLIDWLPSAATDAFTTHLGALFATGEPGRLTSEWAGRTLDLEVSLLAGDQDSPACAVLIATDITERVAGEQALGDCRLVVDAAAEAMAVLGCDYRYRAVNAAYCRLVGRPSEEIIGRHAAEVLGDDVWARVKSRADRCVAGEAIRETDWYEHPGGGRRYLDASYAPCRAQDGGIFALVSVLRDVTADHMTQKTLREKEANLARASQLARLGSWVWRAHTQSVEFSDEQYRILGAEPGQARIDGKLLKSLIHPDDADLVTSAVRDAIGSGVPYDIEFRFQTLDGRPRYAHASADVTRATDGAVEAVYGSMQDITERRLVELERERLITQLQEALAEIKALRGLIPICAWCKRIRDDQGYWQQIEEYLLARSDVEFTHCICPECLAQAEAAEGVGFPSTSE